MKSRPAHSFGPRDKVQGDPEPVRVGLSAHHCATEEAEKIREIREQENESLRHKSNHVAGQASALAQEQQAPDGSQGSILDVIRVDLDEKVDKLPKALADISTLIEEVFTLRHNTNTLHESESALRRNAQER